MNPFLLSPSDRLKEWRDFRNYLNNEMSDIDHLIETVKWWSQCPISPTIVIDPYDPTNWPTGWELIHYGDFCKSSIGLGMEQTLLLNEYWTPERVELWLIDDNGEDIYLTPCIDKTWILNYEINTVNNIHDIDNIKILDKFIFEENGHSSSF